MSRLFAVPALFAAVVIIAVLLTSESPPLPQPIYATFPGGNEIREMRWSRDGQELYIRLDWDYDDREFRYSLAEQRLYVSEDINWFDSHPIPLDVAARAQLNYYHGSRTSPDGLSSFQNDRNLQMLMFDRTTWKFSTVPTIRWDWNLQRYLPQKLSYYRGLHVIWSRDNSAFLLVGAGIYDSINVAEWITGFQEDVTQVQARSFMRLEYEGREITPQLPSQVYDLADDNVTVLMGEYLWNAEQDTVDWLEGVNLQHFYGSAAAAFLPESNSAVVYTAEHGIRIYDSMSGRSVLLEEGLVPDQYGNTVFSPDGRWLAIEVTIERGGQTASGVFLYNVEQGTYFGGPSEMIALPEIPQPEDEEVNPSRHRAVTWTPDGEMIAVVDGERGLLLYDMDNLT
jgi:hypothetical protein